MSATDQAAFVTPRLVKWARERVGQSIDKVAAEIGLDREQISKWEQGDAHPTFREAQQLANLLSIPFGYLYLSLPPKQDLPLPDFRTLPDASALTPSAEFLDLLNDVLFKQQWYRDYLQEDGGTGPTFVGRFTPQNSVDQIANDIRETLHIDDSLRNGCAGRDAFMVALVRRAEASGILVMRSRTVGNSRALSVSEFRGFAISDTIAPLVFINGQDAKAAQVFTLAHELAHIWIGKSGISNPSLQEPLSDTNQLERLCNHIAAEVLIPALDFTARWIAAHPAGENMRALSHHYKVSTLVVLRRAYDLGKLTSSEYSKLYRRERNRFIQTEKIEPAGKGEFYATLRARNGNTFTAAVVTAALERRILLRDAAQLLHVKIPTIQKIANRLAEEGS